MRFMEFGGGKSGFPAGMRFMGLGVGKVGNPQGLHYGVAMLSERRIPLNRHRFQTAIRGNVLPTVPVSGKTDY